MTPFLLLALLLATSSGADELSRHSQYAGDALAYASLAGLPAISESESVSEVRVWRSVAILGLLTCWVVTEGEVRIYSNHHVVDGVIHADDNAMRLVSSKRTTRAARLLDTFHAFAELDGLGILCPVKDGMGLLVEGNRGPTHFAFYAGNPGRCTVPHARDIWRAFKELRRVGRDAP